jgi:hypothetical protein
MAERDGMWPGEVAQPRKPPPDLGTQPFTMPQRSPSVNLYTDARTRDPFPFACELGTQDVMLHFGAPGHAVHGPYEIAVI